jgi:hypothetical protein
MNRKRRLLVAPVVEDLATLRSLVARLGHYFAHVDAERIAILVAPALATLDPMEFVRHHELPAGFDRTVAERTAKVAPVLKFFAAPPGRPIPTVTADFLLFWDSQASTRSPWQELARPFRINRTRFDIDWERTRNDGSWFAEAALVLSRSSRAFDPEAESLFKARTAHLLEAPVASLVATGPSVRQALDIDMHTGVRIACNTTILDTALMDHVRPDIVTFADPIFHVGP